MVKWGYDDVNGIIVGGNELHGRIFYDNRQQGNDLYADSENELKTIANDKIESLKKEYAGICYCDGKEWELRIY